MVAGNVSYGCMLQRNGELVEQKNGSFETANGVDIGAVVCLFETPINIFIDIVYVCR